MTDPFTGRYIVICFDGTSNVESTITNVGMIHDALVRGVSDTQVVSYVSGVGTENIPAADYKIWTLIKNVTDMAVAWSLGDKVVDAYCYLAGVASENDRVCFFGFSRGSL